MEKRVTKEEAMYCADGGSAQAQVRASAFQSCNPVACLRWQVHGDIIGHDAYLFRACEACPQLLVSVRSI